MASGVGLFGKTQFRRDFLTVAVPRPLLTVWEGWLTRGLARSRLAIAEGWTERFLVMPVWHGALGQSLCGIAAVVAVMPSMDGAGRCFPLSVLAWSDEPGAGIAVAAWQAWSDAAEKFLLGTLDETSTHEATLAALDRVPGFPTTEGCAAETVDPAGSVWFTRGGERVPPDRFTVAGLPGDDALTDMIGGAPAPSVSEGEDQHVG